MCAKLMHAKNSGDMSLRTGAADGGRGGNLNVGTSQSDSGMTGNDGDGGNIYIYAGDGLSAGAPKPPQCAPNSECAQTIAR